MDILATITAEWKLLENKKAGISLYGGSRFDEQSNVSAI